MKKTYPKPLTNFLRNDKLDNVASEKTTLENSLKNISNCLLTEWSKPAKLTKSLFEKSNFKLKTQKTFWKKELKKCLTFGKQPDMINELLI